MAGNDLSAATRKVRPFFKSIAGALKESLGKKKSNSSHNRRSRSRHTISMDEFGALRETTEESNSGGKGNAKRVSTQRRRSHYKLALQTEDEDEDVVVISGLERAPFGCPDELYSMTQHDLLRVATFLNMQLPKAQAIDTTRLYSGTLRQKIASIMGFKDFNPSNACSPQISEKTEYQTSSQQIPDSSHTALPDLLVDAPTQPTPRRRSSYLESLAEQDGELDFDPVCTELSPSRRSRGRSLYRASGGLRRATLSALPDSPTPKSRSTRILDDAPAMVDL